MAPCLRKAWCIRASVWISRTNRENPVFAITCETEQPSNERKDAQRPQEKLAFIARFAAFAPLAFSVRVDLEISSQIRGQTSRAHTASTLFPSGSNKKAA